MGLKNLIRVAIFFDGYFFYKFSTYCLKHHPVASRLNLKGFQAYVLRYVADQLGVPLKEVRLAEAHYFWGRPKANEEGNGVLHPWVRFEDALIASGVVIHPSHLAYEEERMVEKGVDISLAVEALDLAHQGRYDLLVLVAGDADFVPLVRKLASLGVGVVVPKVDEHYEEDGKPKVIKTSLQLVQEAHFALDLSRELRSYPWPSESEVWRMFLTKEKEEGRGTAFNSFDYPPEPLEEDWRTGVVEVTTKGAIFVLPDDPVPGLEQGRGLFVPPVGGLGVGVKPEELTQGKRIRFRLGRNTYPPHFGKLVALEVTPIF